MNDDPNPRRHTMQPASWVGGSTDIGQRHSTNQDALALAIPDTPDTAILVVSDGVTSSMGAERASLHASQAAANYLVEHRDLWASQSLEELFERAYVEANSAVLANGGQAGSIGSCTLVCAVIQQSHVAVANIGDTRAYWIPDSGESLQLSVDDSMAQAHIELGMSREEAEKSLHAHAITKWLGAQASDLKPRVSQSTLPGPGWVVVCSDGLWNYASSPEQMANVVGQFWRSMPTGDGPAVLSAALAAWANAQGGKDNITVAVARLG